MDNLKQGFDNPQAGMLGMGAAQNAGSMLKWREAYNQYVTDAASNGEQPVPMAEFVSNLAKAMQSQQAPMQQAQPKGMMSGLLGRVIGR